MYRIIDGRGSGKTSRLMLIAKENNALFVCNNPSAMQQKAHAYGITGIEFISYYDFITIDKWRDTDPQIPVVIDEAEALMKYMNPYFELIGYSISEDD